MKSARYDFWLADGRREFGVISGQAQKVIANDAPICLQRGDQLFGAEHIERKHGHWLKELGCSVPALVWKKCRQSGSVYTCEDDSKSKIWLPLHPGALMVLNYVHGREFWTVLSLYHHQGNLDGQQTGRYVDSMKPGSDAEPVFEIPELPPEPKAPVVTYKRRRAA